MEEYRHLHHQNSVSKLRKVLCVILLSASIIAIIILTTLTILSYGVVKKIEIEVSSLSSSITKIPNIVDKTGNIVNILSDNLQRIIGYYYQISDDAEEIIAKAEDIISITNYTLGRVDTLIDRIYKLLNSTSIAK